MRGSYWLADGQILAGGYPGSFKADVTRRTLDDILSAGIRSFVDLTSPADGLHLYEPLLRRLAEEKQIDVAYRQFSITDASVPSTELMLDVLKTIREELAAGRPVYVHCWGGIGRTGTVVGCWLVEEGYSSDDALGRLAELRDKTPDRYSRSPDTDEQVEFVRNWRSG